MTYKETQPIGCVSFLCAIKKPAYLYDTCGFSHCFTIESGDAENFSHQTILVLSFSHQE